MPLARVTLLMFLLVGFLGCKVSPEQQSKALLGEANNLIQQQTKVTGQWVDEFVKAFTPQHRAQFPANRDFLRTHAEKIIKLLDKSLSLSNAAADKYEQAAGLSGNDQQRRGLILFASSFRKSAEVDELVKSQMQMVSDETIVDEKTFNEKFTQSWLLIQQKQRESGDLLHQGKLLLRW